MLLPFFVWQNKELIRIDPEEVVLLGMEGNYTRIYLADGSDFFVRCSMTRALKKLPAEIFIKIHKSFVASVLYINNVSRDHLTIGGKAVPVGRLYYAPLVKKLNVLE